MMRRLAIGRASRRTVLYALLTSAIAAAAAASGCSGGANDTPSAPEAGAEEAASSAPDTGADGGAVDASLGADASDAYEAGDERATGDAGVDATDANDGGADALDAQATTDASDASALGFDCSAAGDAAAPDYPQDLACTGLYADWPHRVIAPGVRFYDPGLHLWSDGADKTRWIYLPQGTRIDTSDMNEWVFPVGTKIWKEFRLGGHAVETRFLWKRTSSSWLRAVYRWSGGGSAARAIENGETNVDGTTYEIPSRQACTTCHMGRIDNVLGFEAISLGSPEAAGLTLSALVAEGSLTSAPSPWPKIPGAGTPARDALAWLHANCGTACHNGSPGSFAGSTGLWMRLTVEKLATVEGTDTYTTAVNVPSGFQPSPDAGLLRIKPHDAAMSAIPFRDGTRDDQGQGFQMPPIDTHVVDDAGVGLVKSWIGSMP